MKDTFKIALIVVIILLLLTTGCTTTKETAKVNYQLIPISSGLIRFNSESGKTDFMIQTPAGPRWLTVPETEFELIPVPMPQRSQFGGLD